MNSKLTEEEKLDLDRFWRWIEYEKGRDFQFDLFDEAKLEEEK